MRIGACVYTVKDGYVLGDNIQSKVLAFAFGLSAEIERNLISQRTKEALKNVHGTETEVYARIVGYYRSVRNWNKGKRDEYDHRKMFVYGDEIAAKAQETAKASPQREAFAVYL